MRPVLKKYFDLLDEKRTWHNRSPFPKTAELEQAERVLRTYADGPCCEIIDCNNTRTSRSRFCVTHNQQLLKLGLLT